MVRLEARPANVEGAGAVTLRDLVRQALRMRPDRLVVGEVRGAECVDLLAALNTGHEGGCGTVHANAPEGLPARIEALAVAAGLDRAAVHAQLAAGLDIDRPPGAGSRRSSGAWVRWVCSSGPPMAWFASFPRSPSSRPGLPSGSGRRGARPAARSARAMIRSKNSLWALAACGGVRRRVRLRPGRRAPATAAPRSRHRDDALLGARRHSLWAAGVPAPALWGATVMVTGLITALSSDSAVLAALSLVAGAVLARTLRGRLRQQALERRQDAVVDLCTALAAELRAGVAAPEALERTAFGPAHAEVVVRRALSAARSGGDVAQGLRWDAAAPGAEGLGAVAACWEVAMGSGAAMSPALRMLARGLRAEQAHRREVAATLAAPRATARLLALLPGVGILMGTGLGVDPLGLLLGTPLGAVLLVTGGGLALVGMIWTERLARAADPSRSVTTWWVVLAAVLSSGAVAVWPHPAADSRRRLRAVSTRPISGPARVDARGTPSRQRRGFTRHPAFGRRAAAGLAAVGTAVLIGGALGLAVGGVVGTAFERILRGLEPAAVRRRRTAVRDALPGAADLLAACLTAGAPIETATATVARAVGGPLGEHLDSVIRSVRLGSSPVQAWTAAALDPELAPLATALARASRGGAPPADVMAGAAEDLRDRRRTEASMAAQRVGVHAIAPLALCFLPAFVLLGIVPLVVGLAQQLFRGSW